MTTPKLAKTIGGVRHYQHPGTGDWIPSVTAVLAHSDGSADGLVGWGVSGATKVTFDYLNTQLDGLNGGMFTPEQLNTARGKSFLWRNEASERGTRVHAACEKVLDGHTDSDLLLDYSDVDGYIQAFRAWLDDWAPDVEWQELTVFGTDPPVAGTADLAARLGGLGRVLIDLKSAKNLKHTYFVQCAAYASADIGVTHNGDTIQIGDFDRVGVLMLRPDGGYGFHHKPVNPDDVDTFALCTEISRRVTDLQPLPAAAPRPDQEKTPMALPDTVHRLNTPATPEVRDGTYERVKALTAAQRDELRGDFTIGDPAWWATLTGAMAAQLAVRLDQLEGWPTGLTAVAEGFPGAELVEIDTQTTVDVRNELVRLADILHEASIMFATLAGTPTATD